MSDQPQPQTPPTTNWWVLATLNGSISFMWTLLLMNVIPLSVLGIVGETAKEATVAKVLAVGLGVGVFSFPLMGWISDRLQHVWWRRHGMILVGGVTTVAALVTLPFAQSVLLLIAVFTALQLFGSMATSPYFSLLPSLIPQQDRGKASGAKAMLELLGRIAVPVCAGFMLSNFDAMKRVLDVTGLHLPPRQSALFNVSVVCAVLMALGTWAVVYRIPVPPLPTGPAPESPHKQADHLSAATRRKGLFYLIVNRGFNQAAIIAITAYLLYYMLDFLGAKDEQQANLWMSIILLLSTLLSIPTALLTGHWVDRFGRKKFLVLSSLGLMLLCIAFMVIGTFVQACFVGALFGLVMGMYMTSDWAIAVDLVPHESSSAFSMGLWQSSLVLGQIVGAPLAGMFLAWGNERFDAPNGYYVMFSFVAVCLLLALAALAGVPETLKPKPVTGEPAT